VSTRFLGLEVDNRLTWKTHITNLCQTLSSNIFLIRSLSSILNKHTILSLNYAAFYSQVKYGIVFWGSSREIITVFKLQKKGRSDHYSHTFPKELQKHFLTIKHVNNGLYIYEVLKLTKNNLHNYSTHSDIHNHNTRNKNKLSQITHRTKTFEKSPLYSGITLYNKLPKATKGYYGPYFILS